MAAKIKSLAATPAFAMLSACGGSTTGGIEYSETISIEYSDTLGNVSSSFNNGVELKPTEQAKAQLNINWRKTSGERTTTLEKPTFVSIQKGNGDNLLIVKMEGKSYHLSAEHMQDGDEDGTYEGLILYDETDDLYVGVYGQMQELEYLLSQANQADSSIIDYRLYDFNDESAGGYGYAVIGATTNPDALGDFTLASYSGRMNAETLSKDNFFTRQTRVEFYGDTSLVANFEELEISGLISNITFSTRHPVNPNEDGQLGGNIVLSEAPINGNSFSGDAVFDAELMDTFDAASANIEYSGNFYGNLADDASGTLQGTVIGNDGSQDNLLGGFRTSQ